MRLPAAFTVLGAALLVALAGCGVTERSTGSPHSRALAYCVDDRLPDCIAAFQAIVDRDPEGREGDEARVGLALAFMQSHRDADAVEALKPVVDRGEVVPEYSALLVAKAVVSGGLRDDADWARRLLQAKSLTSESRNVRERAALLAVRLLSLAERHEEAGITADEFVRSHPLSLRIREALWLAGESHRLQGDRVSATVKYATLWYGGPAKEWGTEALERLRQLREWPPVEARPQSGLPFLSYLRSLQGAGLHDIALKELEMPEAFQVPAARLAMKATSLHALRRNSKCQATAMELRRGFPSSSELPGAALAAVRCLRRLGNEAPIAEWVGWLRTHFPKDAGTERALYELGSFRINSGDVAKGIQDLEEIIRRGVDNELADDALWRVCWAKRGAGDTAGAVDALRRLLAANPQSGFRKAALYWMARLVESTDPAQAKAGYRILLSEFPHDYYGHEARRNLVTLGETNVSLGSSAQFPRVDALRETVRFPSDESYVRGVSLARLGLFEYAQEELEELAGVHEDLRFSQALLLSFSGSTGAAIELCRRHFPTFVQSGSRDPSLVPREFWKVLYPYRFRSQIRSALEGAGLEGSRIDDDLVAAVILMESRFEPRARSPVGALGLMQLMPETASRTALRAGLIDPDEIDLYDPAVNIRLGGIFLAQLAGEFEGDWFRAICSYNAGPGAVKRWEQTGARDEYIETIPFLDTRLYLKQVLGNYWNYQWIYRGSSE